MEKDTGPKNYKGIQIGIIKVNISIWRFQTLLKSF